MPTESWSAEREPGRRPGLSRRGFLQASALSLFATACSRALPPAVIGAGDPFPAFTLPDLQQRAWHRDDLLGAPHLINYWATWCPPCREEMAGLQVLHRQLQGLGGGVVAVSVDDDVNLVREFLLKLTVDYPVLLDRGRVHANGQLSLQSFPTSFLLRADGRVAEVFVGARAWEAPDQVARVLAAVR